MHRPGVEYWSGGQQPPLRIPQPISLPARPSVVSSSVSSSGPPSLSHTSTADFYVPSDHAVPPPPPPPQRRSSTAPPEHAHASALSTSRFQQLHDEAEVLHELKEAREELTRLQAQQQQEETRWTRQQAAWTRERVEYKKSLDTLEASLARERALRSAAETERQSAWQEGRQLRAALRALLAQPAGDHHGTFSPSSSSAAASLGNTEAVPLVLYNEARQLLVRCERAFAELKMLQLKATDPAGVELLRRYDVPVLDGIPPPWPPVTPRKGVRSHLDNSGNGETQMREHSVVNTPTAATQSRQTAAEEATPTGPEVSALTTVSPETPCSPAKDDDSSLHTPIHPAPSHSVNSIIAQREKENVHACDVSDAPEKVETRKAVQSVAAPEAASRNNNSSAMHANSKNSAGRRVLISPPVHSPSLDSSDVAEEGRESGKKESHHRQWSGPMHEFSENATIPAAPMHTFTTNAVPPPQTALSTSATVPARTPSSRITVVKTSGPPSATEASLGLGMLPDIATRLRPEPGAQLSEFEREDVIRDTDRLMRQLSRETVALAKSQGLRGSADLAALCRRRGLDYVDPAFLPITETLGLASGGCRGYDPDRGTSFLVQWCSPDTFLPQGRRAGLLTTAGVDPTALACGRLRDGGVVAALAALAEAAGAVTSVLASTTPEDEASGLYVAWLCVHGWWTRVSVDAYLPCVCHADGSVTLYGCRNTATHDLWAPVCEKALAKVYGTYQALRFVDAEAALGHLTGGPVECWDWWRQRSDTALAEMEAAINTNARGAGVVLLTTFAAAALQDVTRGAAVAEVRRAYERLGLRPDTAYRVLAVATSAEGDAMVLLRNWAAPTRDGEGEAVGSTRKALMASRSGAAQGWRDDRRDVSPLRDDETHLSEQQQQQQQQVGQRMLRDSDASEGGCLWLNYRAEVLALFDKCHVGFDCRRFHDARYPVYFSGTAPAVPEQLIRVRVHHRPDSSPRHTHQRNAPYTDETNAKPTRLWIGLHQPCASTSGTPSESATAAQQARLSWSLKMTLIGVEEVPSMYTATTAASAGASVPHARPAQRAYVLSESFLGEMQVLPAVWMYIELDPSDFTAASSPTHGDIGRKGWDEEAEIETAATAMEFYVVPQMEWVEACHPDDDYHRRRVAKGSAFSSRRSNYERSSDNSGDDDEGSFLRDGNPIWSRSSHRTGADTNAGDFPGARTSAIVAVLAEQRDAVTVEVVAAPVELRAAMYHDVVDRLDFTECTPLRAAKSGGSSGRGAAFDFSTHGDGVAEAMGVRCQLNGRCLPHFAW